MATFEMVAKVADKVMFNLEDNEVYGKIAQCLSLCVGNFHLWQALATVGFYRYLRRLADKFTALPVTAIGSPVGVGPSIKKLLEEKETALKDAASKNNNLDRKNAGLRVKLGRLQSKVNFIVDDRSALVREKLTFENRLGDFNSWPEFRTELEQVSKSRTR